MFLDDKKQRSLRRLMRGEGKSVEDINQLFEGDPDLVHEAWYRYQAMTRAQRDRLFANADLLKRKAASAKVAVPVPGIPDQTGKQRGRGLGRVPAGESFTFVVPSGLLSEYRELAKSEQRPVAQLVRLAMLHYLSKG